MLDATYTAHLAHWGEPVRHLPHPHYTPAPSTVSGGLNLMPGDLEKQEGSILVAAADLPTLRKGDLLRYEGARHSLQNGRAFRVQGISQTGSFLSVRLLATNHDHRGAL